MTVDVSEVYALSAGLAAAADRVPEQVRAFVASAGEDIRARMRDEVPVDQGETRDSITVEVTDDGMTVEVGPTNRDAKGRPIGTFIEYGSRGVAPNPFVLRTATWVETAIPDRANALLDGVL